MNLRVFSELLFGLALFVFFVVPISTQAASIYFAPSLGNYTVGEQFSINIFVSSGAQGMNAIKATVESSNNNLQLISVSQSGSIIDFWAQGPQVNGDGSAYFEGVMLGNGYYGSAGKLVTLVFRARSAGNVTLAVSSGSVLANDGLGTELPTDLGKASFSILAGRETPVPVVETIPKGFVFTKDLQQESEGDEVRYLQACLKDQGFYTEDITSYFGTQTKQAVIDFQEYYRDEILAPWGFEQGTGLVQKTTREKLNEVCFVASAVEKLEQQIAEEPISAGVVTKEEAPFYTNIWFWVGATISLAIIIILLLIVIVALLLRQMSKHSELHHQVQILGQKEAMLRQGYKHLLITKTKIENELQEVENKLKKFSKGKANSS